MRAPKALYASDASNYRQVPLGVVVPSSVDDLVKALDVCLQHDVPFLTRGGGTSQNGQCVNVAVVADTSKYLNSRTAIVEPGVICDTLRDAAGAYSLTFGRDPATRSRCTLGDMIANNSCGAHSVMAGKTAENVEALEVGTYDGARFWVRSTSDAELQRIIDDGTRQGTIYRQLRELRDRYADAIRREFPQIRRRVSGFNLDQLLPENGFNVARALVGTEGTCAVTLQAKVGLVHSSAHRVILVLGFADIFVAADGVAHFERFGPIAIEGLDRAIIRGAASARSEGRRDRSAARGRRVGRAGVWRGRAQWRARKPSQRVNFSCQDRAARTSPASSLIGSSVAKMQPWTRCDSAITCAASRRSSTRAVTKRVYMVTSATVACTRASHSICAALKA